MHVRVVEQTPWAGPYVHIMRCGSTTLKSAVEDHPNLIMWHEFGMEWKEHVGWLSPILATAVAFIVIRYGPRLVEAGREQRNLRWMLAALFIISFLAAAVSGALGAFI